jgi:hypothetical protein
MQTEEPIEQHASRSNDGKAHMYLCFVGKWVPFEMLQVHDAIKVLAPLADSTNGLRVELATDMLVTITNTDWDGVAEVCFPSLAALSMQTAALDTSWFLH